MRSPGRPEFDQCRPGIFLDEPVKGPIIEGNGMGMDWRKKRPTTAALSSLPFPVNRNPVDRPAGSACYQEDVTHDRVSAVRPLATGCSLPGNRRWRTGSSLPVRRWGCRPRKRFSRPSGIPPVQPVHKGYNLYKLPDQPRESWTLGYSFHVGGRGHCSTPSYPDFSNGYSSGFFPPGKHLFHWRRRYLRKLLLPMVKKCTLSTRRGQS